MSEIYPNFEDNNEFPLYYVEFDRGFSKDSFTFFKRNFFYTEEEYSKLQLEITDGGIWLGREGHPYQLFDGFCKDGCVPDKSMIKFMVDAINEKVAAEIEANQI